MFDFSAFSLAVNVGIFVVSALLVWFAGRRLAICADEIATRSGLSEASIGLILLAGVTSLPEIATSFAAAYSGNAPLAVNNLLGSIAMQIAVLAIGDMLYGKHALTSVVPDPVVILQGAINTVLLSIVAMAIVSGDHAFWRAGVWSWGLLLGAVYAIYKLVEAGERKPWVAESEPNLQIQSEPVLADPDASKMLLTAKTVASAIAILTAGYLAARTGDVIAQQSGIGSSFMGVAFLALATSLPEVSTVFAAMRRGLYTMAISDILGTNILNVALLFGVDIVASGAPVLNQVGKFAALAALLGVLLTGLFLAGLAERRDRTVFGMGTDSVLVLLFYSGGLALLYSLRNGP